MASSDERISTGATAILGEDILNWGQPVAVDETIRLVFVGEDTPATLGRFTPTETSTLTSTVPSTPTPEPTEIPTEEPTEEPTEDPTPEPTATPPADTTAPSITAFSLSNPSGQELRTSFESDEDLASIEVSISGAEAVVLTATDFSESVGGGTYTYEATYQASSDGDYTASLDEAADSTGNDGASGQSVTITIETTPISASWPMYQYDIANRGSPSDVEGPTEGEVSWTYTVDGEISSTPIVVNDTVIFEGPSNVIHAVDPADGTEVWTYDVGVEIGSIAYGHERLYFGDDDGQVTALSVTGDEELWTQDIESSATQVCTVVGEKVLFATGSSVVAVAADSGDVLWESSEGSRFAVEGDTVYASNNDGIVALSLEDGSEQWTYTSSDGYRLSKLPTVGETNVFVGSEGGDLFAIDKESGEHNWDAQPGSDVLRRSVAYADGTVYFGPNNETFYALDAATGDELWSFADGLPNDRINHDWNAPAVVDGNVYTGYHTGIIFGFDAATGDELWRVETDDDIQASSPAIVDGTLFIGCRDGNLYAIE